MHLFIFQQIVEEAGGVVSRMDGGEFTVFDRSVLVSNGAVHAQVCSLKSSLFSRIFKSKQDALMLLQSNLSSILRHHQRVDYVNLESKSKDSSH